MRFSSIVVVHSPRSPFHICVYFGWLFLLRYRWLAFDSSYRFTIVLVFRAVVNLK